MKTSTLENITRTGLSRRDFLKASGTGLTFAVVLGPLAVKGVGDALAEEMPRAQFTAWVRINLDNTILIYGPADEMGQGSLTAVPLILAEYMDADWDRVMLEFSPTEPEIFGSGSRNTMMTGGSRSVTTYYPKVRMIGAQIRKVLLNNMAREWSVPVGELTTEPSTVVHAPSGRRMSYGDIARFAQVPEEMPQVAESEMKTPDEFRLIGTDIIRVDLAEKTDGSALFGMDLFVPNMLYGAIVRSPVNGSGPESSNESAVRSMPGIVDIVTIAHGVGVLGDTWEAVLAAHDALEVTWSTGAVAETFNSEDALQGYADVASDSAVPARTVSERGDVNAGASRVVRTYTADYLSDHVYHAQLEPLNAIASVNAAGTEAEVWTGTQSPWGDRGAAAQALGVAPSQITLHRQYSGGGFGRRLASDYVAEAVLLSKAVKRPVKLVWTREDDVQYGSFRPMNLQRMTAGVDADGNIVSWTHTTVGDNPGLLTGGAQIPHYDIENQLLNVKGVPSGVRLSAWRAVAHPFNKYAIEAFLDEVAVGESVDPVEYRRRLMAGSPKAVEVVNTVSDMASRSGPVPDGRARGLAFAERGDSLAAAMVEISLTESSGKINVHRAWLAGNFGIIVQPNSARAQMEGGFVFGLSSVISERISFRNGRVEQSNFSDYPIMSMADAPEIEVEFIASNDPPLGIGELANPLAGGAVANAFLALTGKPLRHTPFTPDKVSNILGRSSP